MRIPPQSENVVNSTIRVLSISPFSGDHVHLKEILSPESRCAFMSCDTLTAAAALAERYQFAVVISEYDLSPGSWWDVLALISEWPVPPPLIVSSRLADERKWAELLNLGAFDLLTKPFDEEEVCRVVGAACRHCYQRHEARMGVSRLSSVGAT